MGRGGRAEARQGAGRPPGGVGRSATPTRAARAAQRAARGYVRAGLEGRNPLCPPCAPPYEEIARLYLAIDAYVVPSRQEGGPKGVLEAMAPACQSCRPASGRRPRSSWTVRTGGSSTSRTPRRSRRARRRSLAGAARRAVTARANANAAQPRSGAGSSMGSSRHGDASPGPFVPPSGGCGTRSRGVARRPQWPRGPRSDDPAAPRGVAVSLRRRAGAQPPRSSTAGGEVPGARRALPNAPRDFNVLYLGSSSMPLAEARRPRTATQCRVPWNQDGVAYRAGTATAGGS